MKMRVLLLGVLFCSVFVAPTIVYAGILEFFFPSVAEKEPNLYETLRAPFADAPIPEKKMNQQDLLDARLPENSVPLNLPHRQVKQISVHASDMVSQALLFEEDDYEVVLSTIFKNFNSNGRVQYQKFLQETNIFQTLQTNKFHVRGFVTDVPLLLNAKAIDGRYRWLFEVPTMVSYFDRNIDDYKAGLKPINQKIIIRLQLGRYKDADNEAGLLIETWSGRVQQPKKK